MSGLDIFQWTFNFASMTAIAVCFFRLKRPPKDDPRLSKGLQLLQSKISVLEDLSDRTEVQVAQMTKLLELKAGQVQKKVQQAELQIRKVEVAMAKSKEVAEIFQDKIPHDEIVERKNTIKYIQAARLAHQGASGRFPRESRGEYHHKTEGAVTLNHCLDATSCLECRVGDDPSQK